METSTTSKWDEQVFTLSNDGQDVEQMSWGEFVREHGADETTSPRGVAPRIHIRHNEEIEYVVNDKGEEVLTGEIKYEIWSWGISGNHPSFTGTSFDTEEEAEEEVLKHFEYNCEKSDQTPMYYSTEQEATDDIILCISDKENIAIEVATSIYEKMQKLKLRRAALSKISEEKRLAERAESMKHVESEAQLLFEKRNEVENLFNVVGMNNQEKQAKQVADMKNLISYSGIENGILKSPFWSVFKAVSAKIYESKKK